MTSPALHPIKPGLVDPRRPGEYPIILGDSLKGRESSSGFVNIHYNWQPKSGFKARDSKLAGSGDKYQLVVQGEDSDDGGYQYDGTLESQESGKDDEKASSLALIFDKSKSAFVLESISSSLDMNLKSGPGQSSRDARDLPQLPTTSRPSRLAARADIVGATSPSADNENPDPSNPYDFRHFLAEARENIEKSAAQPGNRTPIPGGMTPLSGISTPVPSASTRFKAMTPQFRPTTSKPPPQKGGKSPDPPRAARGSSGPSSKTGPTKRDTAKQPSSSSAQPLSKARITDCDDEDDDDDEEASSTIDVSRTVSSRPSTSTNTTKPTTSKFTNPPASASASARRGHHHARTISANIGSSPHIIINDDDGDLQIDMGSPPPEDRARRARVDPEMFRSHTGTPVGGLSTNHNRGPLSRVPADTENDRNRNRNHHRDRDVTMKDIEAGATDDEDGDVEEFELGSPRDKALGVRASGDVSMMEDNEEEEAHRQTAPTSTSHAPVLSNKDNNHDDDEDLLEAALEAALEEEDEQAGHGVGLGIGMSAQDDESEVSEEE
ncbi:hypothetical protein LTR99_006901 [Exophiala xenobiotica]|uniref:Transcription elongation factor Eaf N-terminal domain-containing protein n=1 Tax=Vermiconidia calcicola TaxID=1690605 RepID=A0AAV9PY63_9PEZI|nr:hypothetical protein LTR72_006836 [Exophiala xenobiotica]KAK5531897.1 hypothetical protein LTR25_008227 [Vermiconidia calcicola]KAK5537275.1 hypothetical protein LTR23_007486 [Chaetothyriales sp. CCFEE 6169]KAK5269467.1 hypothetical protein LTR96_005163 [Exophiala xenobiotica]KAK5286155.1 hypothetical protein LTR14_010409 [Exophiala xenobiotica]